MQKSAIDTIYTSSDSIDMIFGSVLQQKRWSCQVIHGQVGLAREPTVALIYDRCLVFEYTKYSRVGLVKKHEHAAISFVKNIGAYFVGT